MTRLQWWLVTALVCCMGVLAAQHYVHRRPARAIQVEGGGISIDLSAASLLPTNKTEELHLATAALLDAFRIAAKEAFDRELDRRPDVH